MLVAHAAGEPLPDFLVDLFIWISRGHELLRHVRQGALPIVIRVVGEIDAGDSELIRKELGAS